MDKLSHSEIVVLLVSLSLMLVFAKLLGELARKFRQPSVAGEILAGIILGPTILGFFSPEIFQSIFPGSGNTAIAFDGIIAISVVLLLFISGIEVELDIVRQQGRSTLLTAFFGMLIPFGLGFALAWYWPGMNDLHETGSSHLLFSLFMGTAMAITALPVIARILIDLRLFKTPMGMTIVSSAMANDLVGWIFFSILLSMMGTSAAGMSLMSTILLTLAFAFLMLTGGKYLINRALPWINKNFSWPGGLLAFAMAACFIGAAFTEHIGIHSIFGAFIIGVAFGDSVHMSTKAKEIIHQFVNNIFAPLFFVSIGLRVDFIAHFDWLVVLAVIVIAYIGKLTGASLGAYLSGFKRNEAFAIGSGMNARGAMEIILGTIALEAGLINEAVLVALIIMALLTSMTSGEMIRYFMKKQKGQKQ